MSLDNSKSKLDHLVVIANDLEQGCDHIEAQIGVRPRKGGKHTRMGTHNCLLRLGNDAYLEVIAIDPDASAPDRPRWFGLDDREQRLRVARGPFLAAFVAATDNIRFAASSIPELGQVQEMQRDGMHWDITVREDGALVEGGTVPVLIQWPEGMHPLSSMPDLGCRLISLEIAHPEPERIRQLWGRARLDESRLSLAGSKAAVPVMRARIATPHGEQILT